MNSRNLYNLLFAGIVLFAVLFGGVRNETKEEAVLEQKPESTSLAAVVKTSPLPDFSLTSLPNLSAAAVLVKDLTIAEPLFLLNGNQQWPIASLTKLMTAVIVEENFSKDAKIPMSERAILTEGNAGYFAAGAEYSVSELLNPLLRFSSNDAAEALAEFYGREKFLEAMNRKATELGMPNTRFFDPTGLSPLNQSTLDDLEKIIVFIFWRHPEILEITRQKEGSTHPFAGYENFLGGKTGFIDEANGNLISLFNYENRPLLIIVLGSEDRYLDTLSLYNRFTSH